MKIVVKPGKSSKARKQLKFMADVHLETALQVRAEQRGVTVGVLVTELLSKMLERGLQDHVLSDLTPGLKAQFGQLERQLEQMQTVLQDLQGRAFRASFESTLVRYLLLNHLKDTRTDFDERAFLRAATALVKERLDNPFLGLEEYQVAARAQVRQVKN